jgi:general secretion pathway protein C
MPFDLSLRKNFWLVPLPLIAIAALLNAQAVSQLVGTAIALDQEQLVRPPPIGAQHASSAPSTRVTSAQAILERNPFDHVTGSLVSDPAETADGGAPAERIDTSDPWNAPTCEEVDVRAIVASGDEDWSFASLAGADGKPHLFRRGGEIGGKTVHFIGRDRVWLTTDESLCQTRLFDTKKVAAAPAAVAPVTSLPFARSRGAPLGADLRKGIQAVSPTEFNIDRSVVDKILENQADLMRQARIFPVQENGRVVGVRLLGVRPDALLGVLGMQNGDQLRSINGFELGSPEKALEAYARLRTADKLTIQLNRGGKNMNLDYNIK